MDDEITKLDLYEIIGTSITADESEVNVLFHVIFVNNSTNNICITIYLL
jgi:hypothetical protein